LRPLPEPRRNRGCKDGNCRDRWDLRALRELCERTADRTPYRL